MRVMDDVVSAHSKHLKFKGLAKVSLGALDFTHPAHRSFAKKNVRRLVQIFTIEGCQRLDDGNFIDAVAEETQLEALSGSLSECLHASPVRDWSRVPFLRINHLKCLTGQHRICAAQTHLDVNDQWWIVRIYTDSV